MVDIVLYSLKGLYMGPVAQIAAMLAIATNDNSHLSSANGALSYVKPQKNLADVIKQGPAWLENKEKQDRETDIKNASIITLFKPSETDAS